MGADVLLDRDLCIVRGSRLRLRLVVFRNWSSMNRFWRDDIGKGGLHRQTKGAVNSLSVKRLSYYYSKETSRIVHDPRYFAVMAPLSTHLSMNIIAHESVHAGFAYAKRLGGRASWGGRALEFDEESVAYPAGLVAHAVNKCLWEAKLFKN